MVGLSWLRISAPAVFGVFVLAGCSDPRFDELDKNGDGMITRDEAAEDPQLLERFGALDENLDGRLNRVEYSNLNLVGEASEHTQQNDKY